MLTLALRRALRRDWRAVIQEWESTREEDRRCVFGQLAAGILTTYGDAEAWRTPKRVAELTLSRWMVEVDIVTSECDHASHRRMGARRAQKHCMSVSDMSAERMVAWERRRRHSE